MPLNYPHFRPPSFSRGQLKSNQVWLSKFNFFCKEAFSNSYEWYVVMAVWSLRPEHFSFVCKSQICYLFIFNISNVAAIKNISTFPKCLPGPPSNIWQVVVCCLSHLAMLAAWRICNKGNNGRIIIRNIKELTQQCTELSITQSRIALFLGRIKKTSLPRVKTLNTFLLV